VNVPSVVPGSIARLGLPNCTASPSDQLMPPLAGGAVPFPLLEIHNVADVGVGKAPYCRW
jgi:hypothetical protein